MQFAGGVADEFREAAFDSREYLRRRHEGKASKQTLLDGSQPFEMEACSFSLGSPHVEARWLARLPSTSWSAMR
jgi:hypothetical protein